MTQTENNLAEELRMIKREILSITGGIEVEVSHSKTREHSDMNILLANQSGKDARTIDYRIRKHPAFLNSEASISSTVIKENGDYIVTVRQWHNDNQKSPE